eukprot:3319248-Pyramimonas_sp.AAC.1
MSKARPGGALIQDLDVFFNRHRGARGFRQDSRRVLGILDQTGGAWVSGREVAQQLERQPVR